jgi:hypothetical protein
MLANVMDACLNRWFRRGSFLSNDPMPDSLCSSVSSVVNIVVMDERDYYDEKEAKKPHTLNCPHCRQANEYELSWLVRTKKKQLPPRADERDRAKFAKAQSYMVRREDMVACKNIRCRKRFEVAGVQSVAFIE